MVERKKKWNKDDLIKAVSLSHSKRQVLSRLKLVEAGGNYQQISKYIALYKINTSHFLGQRSNLGKIIPRKPIYS